MRYLESRLSRGALTAVATAFLLVFGSGVLQAQQQPGQQQDIEVDEQELQTFTEAHIEIEELRSEMQARMQDAEGREEAQQIQQQTNQQMIAIIEEEDLTAERYSQIASAINQDAELRERFQQLKDRLLEEEEDDAPGR